MAANDLLPVGQFSPARGINVDRTEKSIRITGRMEIYGPEATAARAKSVETAINSTWTATFPNGFTVTTSITVTYRGPKALPGNVAQIEAVLIAQDSFVLRTSPTTANMVLNAKNNGAFGWVAAHEFGHIIGLRDRYIESIQSKQAGAKGGQRTTAAEPGYGGNIMAVHNGTLWGKNATDIVAESEPVPTWINDDDYAATWLNSHPIGDVARLSTKGKLLAFQTLMYGWVSTDDLNAMMRLCSSVKNPQEAATIRKAVDLASLTDFGQRSTLRLAMDKMPW